MMAPRKILFLILSLGVTVSSHAASTKKDYSDIFRDYYDLATPHNRQEDISFGMNAQFASVVPFGRIGATQATVTRSSTVDATYGTFFNFQVKPFFRYSYHFEAFFLTGWNSIRADVPIKSSSYQHASLTAFPLLFGFKYRITKTDLVPYISLAAGPYLVTLTVSEDETRRSKSEDKTSLGYQAAVGAEIFIEENYGLGFELGLEQIHHGTVSLNNGFNDGAFQFSSRSGGVLLTSSFFYEF